MIQSKENFNRLIKRINSLQRAVDCMYCDSSPSGDYIPLSQKGQPNGVSTLDAGGKIPASQLPNSVMELQGSWDASTNTPTLIDGTGNPGDVWEVTVAGTQDLGSGPIAFTVGDWAVYGADGKWYRSPNSNEVTSVFGRTGTVVATTGDYTFAQIGSKPTTVNGYGITDAITQGGNTFGANMLVGTDDNNNFTIKTNGAEALSVAPNGTIFGTSANSSSFGLIALPRNTAEGFVVRKSAANSVAVATIVNANQNSTGNIITFQSNTDGSTVTKSYVAKDGSVIAPNIVYKAPADYGGSLLLGTSTNNAVSITVNNNVIATFTNVGIRCSTGITHNTNLANGGLVFSSGTPTISRNLADATTTFIVDNVHASNTGNIAEFKKAGTTVATIDNNGNIIAPNIQSVNNVASTSLTLSTPGYYTNTGAAVTYTLPAPAGRTGTKYTLINMGSGSISATGGFEDIWEAGTLVTNVSVAAGEVITLYNNGLKWIVI